MWETILIIVIMVILIFAIDTAIKMFILWNVYKIDREIEKNYQGIKHREGLKNLPERKQ
jgi:hypothetical protein